MLRLGTSKTLRHTSEGEDGFNVGSVQLPSLCVRGLQTELPNRMEESGAHEEGRVGNIHVKMFCYETSHTY